MMIDMIAFCSVAYPILDDIKASITANHSMMIIGGRGHSHHIASADDDNMLLREDESSNIPLQIACTQADTIDPAIVEFLISCHLPSVTVQNKFGLNALHIALLNSKKPQLEIIKLLCEASDYRCVLQKNKQKMLPIHFSLKSPRKTTVDLIEILLKEHAEKQLWMADTYGNLAIHQAVCNKHVDVDIVSLILVSTYC